MSSKIGVGLITCNKPDRLKQSAPTIPNVDELVIVNDGEPYPSDVYPKGAEVIQHSKNKGVGISKNDALRYLMLEGCEFLFLMEDDVLIKNPNVFEAYIEAGETSGIWHLNYALQGPANRMQEQQGMDVENRHKLNQTSPPNPREIIEYDDGTEIALYPNCVGAFSFYLRGIIKAVGYNDERFINAWEHVEHTYRIIKLGLHPPFWWFADINKSWEYLEDIPNCIEESTITHTPEWMQNFRQGMAYFQHKYGCIPQKISNAPKEDVLKVLERIEKNYARKVL